MESGWIADEGQWWILLFVLLDDKMLKNCHFVLEVIR